MIPGNSSPAKKCLASLASARMDLQVMARGRGREEALLIDEAVRHIDAAKDMVGRLRP